MGPERARGRSGPGRAGQASAAPSPPSWELAVDSPSRDVGLELSAASFELLGQSYIEPPGIPRARCRERIIRCDVTRNNEQGDAPVIVELKSSP